MFYAGSQGGVYSWQIYINKMPLHLPNNMVAFRTIILKKKENYDLYVF
jgi:hypothetical protein